GVAGGNSACDAATPGPPSQEDVSSDVSRRGFQNPFSQRVLAPSVFGISLGIRAMPAPRQRRKRRIEEKVPRNVHAATSCGSARFDRGSISRDWVIGCLRHQHPRRSSKWASRPCSGLCILRQSRFFSNLPSTAKRRKG